MRGQGAASRPQRQRPAPKSQAGHKSERSGFRQFVVSPLPIPKLTGRWSVALIILALALAAASAARLHA